MTLLSTAANLGPVFFATIFAASLFGIVSALTLFVVDVPPLPIFEIRLILEPPGYKVDDEVGAMSEVLLLPCN